MKQSLPKLSTQLEAEGWKIMPVRYRGPGHILCAIGFDAVKDGAKIIEIEPVRTREYSVSMTDLSKECYQSHQFQHYASRREGYQPALTRNISLLKPDIDQFFKAPDPITYCDMIGDVYGKLNQHHPAVMQDYTIVFGNLEIGWHVKDPKYLVPVWGKAIHCAQGRTYGDVYLYFEGKLIRSLHNAYERIQNKCQYYYQVNKYSS